MPKKKKSQINFNHTYTPSHHPHPTVLNPWPTFRFNSHQLQFNFIFKEAKLLLFGATEKK